MKFRTQIVLAVTAMVSAATLVGGGLAQAANGEGSDPGETETPITGAAFEQASQAALTEVGSGTVTGTEEGDEESYYEVEVTLDDGSQIDVQLDESFRLVDTTPDSETDE